MKQLSITKEWYVDRYFADDVQIEALTKVNILGTEYDVKGREISIDYNDMGHVYTSNSTRYSVEETVFGKKFAFDLTEIIDHGIRVYALEYVFYPPKAKP